MDEKPVAWVEVIPQHAASGDLACAYDAVKGADGMVENLYVAMSQTPQTIQPADAHYLSLLHNPDNPLEPWLAELVATYVAILCGCTYAAQNHGTNFATYLGDEAQAEMILEALQKDGLASLEGDQMLAALRYTRKLSLQPGQMDQEDVEALRDAGFCDKGISYLIQLAASFAYWARMINGLGTKLGDHVGIEGKPRTSD